LAQWFGNLLSATALALPCVASLETSITFAALNKFRRKFSKPRKMRFCDLNSLDCTFIALSSACPDLKTFTTVLIYYNDAPTKSLSNYRTICEIVCMKLFHSASADYLWEKSRIPDYVKTTENMMNYRRLKTYFRDREVVAMLD